MVRHAEIQASATPRCRHCGYDLSGITRANEPHACPECSAAFDPNHPWTPPPWPPASRVALLLCGPAIGLALLLAAFTVVPVLRSYLVWPLWTLWLFALGYFSLRWPFSASARLVWAREPESTRRTTWRRLALGALAVNATATIGALVIFGLNI